jgi:50S ribosomal subunit-associated GTPase HflX
MVQDRVADLSRRESIEHLTIWQNQLINAGGCPPIVLALNKVDLIPSPDLSAFEEQFSQYNATILVSAKTSSNIRLLFVTLARVALERKDNKLSTEKDIVEETKSVGCC